VLPDEDTAAALYDATEEECARAGLLAYEISNYARPGEESRHNLAYWRYLDYAGIGPGAHGRITVGGSLLATRRHRAPEPWAERVERAGHGLTADDPVAPEERAREALLMGLRLTEGVELARFEARTERTLAQSVDWGVMERCVAEGYLVLTQDRLVATREGRVRLDSVLSALVA
jgi:coproporphyrinogen III oxidase-like Fe-S oxidoreductase